MKTNHSKILASLLLIALLVISNGCITNATVNKAKEVDTSTDKNGETVKNTHQAYYALLPLTVPADIATAPFQIIGYLIFWKTWDSGHHE